MWITAGINSVTPERLRTSGRGPLLWLVSKAVRSLADLEGYFAIFDDQLGYPSGHFYLLRGRKHDLGGAVRWHGYR